MADRSDDAVLTHGRAAEHSFGRRPGRDVPKLRQPRLMYPPVAMNVEENRPNPPKDARKRTRLNAQRPHRCVSRLLPAMSLSGSLIASRPSLVRAWPRHQGWMSSKATAQRTGCPLSGLYAERPATRGTPHGRSLISWLRGRRVLAARPQRELR